MAPRSAGSSARLIDGKAVAAEVRERVSREVQELAAANGGRAPGLATVLVGDDPASHVYVTNKRKQTEEVGMRSVHGPRPGPPREGCAGRRVERRRRGDGILVQLPLPARSIRTR